MGNPESGDTGKRSKLAGPTSGGPSAEAQGRFSGLICVPGVLQGALVRATHSTAAYGFS